MKIAPQFQRLEGRSEFERARNAVRTMLPDASPDESFQAFLRIESDFDAGVLKVKPDLLGSVLCWKPEDRELSAWIYEQHREIAELARRAADLFERRLGADDKRTLRLVVLAFLHWGEAAKWVVDRREPYDYAWMHWLMRLAMETSRNLEACEVRLDGRARSANLESLFFRTLLLDRFAGGNLSRQQIEVLDAWIWEWMPALKGCAIWPQEPVFRADLDGKGGLRTGERPDPGPTLYLRIAPLEARRREIIKEFHRGRIVPALGVASDFRVEEHVAVLEQLRAAFEAPQGEGATRVPRRHSSGGPVEVWVGLSEILARGLNALTPATPPHVLTVKKGLSDTQRIRQVQFLDEFESPRRFLRLVDVSDTGYGLEASDQEAFGIGVGDLVGIKLSEDEPCVLGRVARRVPAAYQGKVVIGVNALCADPQALTLSRKERQNRPDDDELFIYVPGCEASGAHDAFVVHEKLLNEPGVHEAMLGDDRFTLQFNRVRGKGRGWALAGFEILEARRVDVEAERAAAAAVSPTMPRFELVPTDDYAHAFDQELGNRLL
ncbi:MAG TPA: hypothetical protein VH040_05720 [Usitatibacter sp.]|jgi:hypothetical protein|nr:hypothetical protein [Usitatibacter sp.]